MDKVISDLVEELELSDNEKKFLSIPDYANTAAANQANIISNFYLSKSLQKISDGIINSNKKAAAENHRLSKMGLILTSALVFVGITQVVAIINNVYIWVIYAIFILAGVSVIRSELKK
ncbi:MAG: hypothetical protein PHO91_02325 [Patescibacteria group bacterium]|nr:hypothetical protein [Patescibacteria group bacterium]